MLGLLLRLGLSILQELIVLALWLGWVPRSRVELIQFPRSGQVLVLQGVLLSLQSRVSKLTQIWLS